MRESLAGKRKRGLAAELPLPWCCVVCRADIGETVVHVDEGPLRVYCETCSSCSSFGDQFDKMCDACYADGLTSQITEGLSPAEVEVAEVLMLDGWSGSTKQLREVARRLAGD